MPIEWHTLVKDLTFAPHQTFQLFYKNVDIRVPLILLHIEKVISSMKNAENVSFKPIITIKMLSSTAI